jgi:2-hydroxychromene-2-carboxylate isomerase
MSERPSSTSIAPTAPREIDFWFDFASNYSYLSMMRIEPAAAKLGVSIEWRPFLLGPVFKAVGWSEPPLVQQKLKGAYVWQDMARECLKYGIPWRRPSTFPRNSVLATRVALFAADRPWMPESCRRVMVRNFGEDGDIASADDLAPVLEEVGVPAEPTLAQAVSEENRQGLRQHTEQALALGVFGGPTFFAGSAMFWGNDRLDDALELACGGTTTAPASPRFRVSFDG